MHTLHRSASSGSIDRRTSAPTRFGAARLLGAGAVALVASVVATFAIREIAVAIVDVPTVFTPLRLSSTLSLAILGTVAAVAVCFALNALSRGSVELFRVIAPLALVASFIPDVAIWADGAYGGAGARLYCAPADWHASGGRGNLPHRVAGTWSRALAGGDYGRRC